MLAGGGAVLQEVRFLYVGFITDMYVLCDRSVVSPASGRVLDGPKDSVAHMTTAVG